jgi:RNA 3'-terminal phosphate cyclase (ATP)
MSGISAVSNLPPDIAVRQKRRATEAFNRRGIELDMQIINAPSPGKGTLVFLCAENDNVVSGFDALGAIGKPAEDVADEACRSLFEHLATKAALDPHLADQIIPFLALCSGASEFTTSRITRHLLTNIWVVEQFADVAVEVEGKEGEEGLIRIVPGVPPF